MNIFIKTKESHKKQNLQLRRQQRNTVWMYPDNCPLRKTAPRLGLVFGSRLESVLGLGATK